MSKDTGLKLAAALRKKAKNLRSQNTKTATTTKAVKCAQILTATRGLVALDNILHGENQ